MGTTQSKIPTTSLHGLLDVEEGPEVDSDVTDDLGGWWMGGAG